MRRRIRNATARLLMGLTLICLMSPVFHADQGEVCAAPPLYNEHFGGWNLYWDEPYLDWLQPCVPRDRYDWAASPVWYAVIEALPLKRDAEDDRAVASRGVGRDNIVLSTSDLDAEFDPATRVTLGRTLSDRYRLEATYYGSYGWSDSRGVRNDDPNGVVGNGNLFSPFTNFGNSPVQGLDYNAFASVELLTSMNNVEVNLRHHVDMPPGPYEVSFLYGGRYMKIEEELNYFTQSNVPGPGGSLNDLQTRTDNDLVGVQLGMLSQFLLRNRLWIDFEMKGAMLQNFAEQDTRYVNTDAGGNVQTSAQGIERERTSFLGDLSLVANYQVAPGVTFRVGYNALWVTGVALSANNFETDPDILRLGPPRLDHSGEIVFHGPNIGMVWAR